MKKGVLFFLLALMCAVGFVGCKGKKTNTIEWKQNEVAVSQYVRENDEIEITYPVAEGAVALSINEEISRTIADFLGNPDKAVSEVVDDLLSERNQDSMIVHIPYTMIVNGEASQYGKTVSVTLNMYQYLGGAHGISRVECLNFDANTGERLNYLSLFENPEALTALNRLFFVKEAPDQVDELFSSVEELPLPVNAVLDSAGLHVYYNTYEIAPYSAGVTEYVIPMEEINDLLRKGAL